MLSPGYYYPEQTKMSEPVVLFVRRHWAAFVAWAAIIVVMCLAPITILVIIFSQISFADMPIAAQKLMICALSAYYLFVLAVFLAAWIDYYLDATIVTERRLVDIHQNGLFNHRISEQSLLRVQDVSVRMQGPFQTFLHYGTVYVETAGEAPNFIMSNMPNPNKVANTIVELHNCLIEQGIETSDLPGAEIASQRVQRIRANNM